MHFGIVAQRRFLRRRIGIENVGAREDAAVDVEKYRREEAAKRAMIERRWPRFCVQHLIVVN
jgi:hypothetical protein